jgi:hypothetical protein
VVGTTTRELPVVSIDVRGGDTLTLETAGEFVRMKCSPTNIWLLTIGVYEYITCFDGSTSKGDFIIVVRSTFIIWDFLVYTFSSGEGLFVGLIFVGEFVAK